MLVRVCSTNPVDPNDLLGFSQPYPGFRENGLRKSKYPVSSISLGKKGLVDTRGQRRVVGLVRDDRKTTVTQTTTTGYNQGLQEIISVHTTHVTLKQTGYTTRGPHWVTPTVS